MADVLKSIGMVMGGLLFVAFASLLIAANTYFFFVYLRGYLS